MKSENESGNGSVSMYFLSIIRHYGWLQTMEKSGALLYFDADTLRNRPQC